MKIHKAPKLIKPISSNMRRCHRVRRQKRTGRPTSLLLSQTATSLWPDGQFIVHGKTSYTFKLKWPSVCDLQKAPTDEWRALLNTPLWSKGVITLQKSYNHFFNTEEGEKDSHHSLTTVAWERIPFSRTCSVNSQRLRRMPAVLVTWTTVTQNSPFSSL